MFDNHLYNLMNQLVVEHKSLWRIRNHYMEDAGDCADCKAMWEALAKEKEGHIEDIKKIIQMHLS